MKAHKVPENRGRASKITVEMVRVIIRAAESTREQGKRLRIKNFTKELCKTQGIELSSKKVREVLIANNLFAPETRRRRPRFYLSLRKEIPNGLLSLDGSEMVVWLDREPQSFNVELGVDVKTFDHTSFSVGDSESSEELIRVLEAHRRKYGNPVGVLFDRRSSNLSEKVLNYLKIHDIEVVPVGPYNAKGNGTDEGAFSQLKQSLGVIRLDLSSSRALARSVLEKLISLYITMRNRMLVGRNHFSPSEAMKVPTTEEQRNIERQKLQKHNRTKTRIGDQGKLDQLHSMLHYHRMTVEPEAMKNAERSIKRFDEKAISAAEEAFLRAVNRNSEKKSLSYFFGILNRIQKERDDQAYRRYCELRYNEQVMRRLRQEQEEQHSSHSIEGILGMLANAVKAKFRFVKELAISKARQWTHELMESYGYPGVLKNRFSKALETLSELTLEQKNQILELIEQFIKPKPTGESVTRIS